MYCAEPPCGQLNPVVNLTFDVMGKVMDDMLDMFQDTVVHLGYDEVNLPCWERDAAIQRTPPLTHL